MYTYIHVIVYTYMGGFELYIYIYLYIYIIGDSINPKLFSSIYTCTCIERNEVGDPIVNYGRNLLLTIPITCLVAVRFDCT